jgi:hypothetical protein
VGEGDLGAFPLCVRLRTCVEIKESS